MEPSHEQQDHSLKKQSESSGAAEGGNVDTKRPSNQQKKKKKPAAPPWHSRLFNSLTETVGASLELLGDGELRKRAVPYVLSNTHVQRGISSAAAFGRQIQVVMSQMEQMSLEKYHQWQLNEHRRQLVDVQVGRLLLMDVPQEVRTRLWFLLLQNPAMREPLKSLRDLARWGEGAVSSADAAAIDGAGKGAGADAAAAKGAANGGEHASSTASCTPASAQAGGTAHTSGANGGIAVTEGVGEGGAGAEEDEDEDAVLQMLEARRAGGAGASTSGSKTGEGGSGRGASRATQLNQQQQRAGPAGGHQQLQEEGSGSDHSFSSGALRRGRSRSMRQGDGRVGGGGTRGGNGGNYNNGDDDSGSDDGEDWEMVDTEGLGYGRSPCRAQEAQAANHRHLFKLLQRRVEAMDGAYDDYRDDHAARAALHADLHALVEALMGVPWTPEQGLSEPCSPESPLALLNDLPSCAEQQEIDEIIMRDINRTFPEHPFFGSAGGQTSLFRLLKAYSLQVLVQALNSPISDDDLHAARASTCTMLASAIKQLRGVDISLKGLAVEDVDAAKADPEVGLAQQQVAGPGGAPSAAAAPSGCAYQCPSEGAAQQSPSEDAAGQSLSEGAAAGAADSCGTAHQSPSGGAAHQSPSEGAADQSPSEGAAAGAADPCGTAHQSPSGGAAHQSPSEGAAGLSPPEGATAAAAPCGAADQSPSTAAADRSLSESASAHATSGAQGAQRGSTSAHSSSTKAQEQLQAGGMSSQQHGEQQPHPPQQSDVGSISQQELPDHEQQQQPAGPKPEEQSVGDKGMEQPHQSNGSGGSLPPGGDCGAEGVLREEEAQEVLRGLQVEDELLEMMLSGHRI
ncbi:hypothetical protein DUNSADRAFT_10573 [Dunaliella salina]|uniref:Uncharacterized protein n=1 Tax=Dunaliella salina TaxID=3046 RepID=A0ABQ7H4T4_DUNSA|nr:hypothetical protein DUNSADRAFT_10573 [Dunaliella salina]|eukprot:KAF5841867.1 hypothetical protein DUNSADRAFT_10573 [Dunaliella salina]